MKTRGTLKKNAAGEYYVETRPLPHMPEEVDEFSTDDLFEDYMGQVVEVDVSPARLDPSSRRGIVRVKPVAIGIPEYRDIHGSVCSADVEGTPPMPPRRVEEFDFKAGSMAAGLQRYEFVHADPHLVIMEHHDLRRLPAELTLDTDAILLSGGVACSPYFSPYPHNSPTFPQTPK